jgi:hypothetical protein
VDPHRCAFLTSVLGRAPSRRDVVRGLAGVGFGLGGLWSAEPGAAKKRRKGKKPKPNIFGCLEVGDACKRAAKCCSGICKRKKCRAHNTGTCKQDGPEICSINPPPGLTCNNDGTCRCFGTTAGSIACSRFDAGVSCVECQRDPDCEDLGFPTGTVCAPFTVGACGGACPGGMACLIPCGVEFPCPLGQGSCGGDCLPNCPLGEFRDPETCECETCTAVGAPCVSNRECCGENRCMNNGNGKVCVFFT